MKKHLIQLRAFLLFSAAIFAAHSLSAAESVALTATPAILNVNAGTALSATTVTITYTISGGSTAVNFATSLPVTPTGLTVSALSKTSDTASGTLTFTVSTTTATPAGAYTIDFNASGGATTAIPLVVVIGSEWTGGGADKDWSTSGNWSFVPGSSSVVDFNNGSASTVGIVNNIVSANTTVNALDYTHGTTGGSGYQVTQLSPGQTLTVAEDVTAGLDNVTTHVVMTNTGNFTVTGDASSYFSVGSGNNQNGTKQVATMVLADGVNTITTASMWIGNSGSNNGSSGNVFSLGNGNNILNIDNIVIGQGKASGTMNFNGATINGNGGTLTLHNRAGTGRAAIILGNGSSGSGASTGSLLLAGHSVSVLASTLTIGSVGNSSGNQVGVATMDTGTMDVTSLILCSTTSGSGNATGTLNFGGSATPGAATLIVNSAGGGSFMISDANRGTQTGNGTFNLNTNSTAEIYCSVAKATAANNTGKININGGTLVLESAASTIGTPSIPIDVVNLTNASIHLNLNGAAIVSNIVAVAMAGSGANTITVDSISGVTSSATFPVISYTGTDPFPGLAGISLAGLPAGYAANLVDNTAQSRIDLAVSSTTPSLVWAGATADSTPDGNWNTTDLNWLNGATYVAYTDGDNVQFDDTASGGAVNLAGTFSPGTVTVTNNVLNYSFTGGGSINSALVKNGTATLTLQETGGDNFAGGLVVNAGTVVIDNASGSMSGNTIIGAGATVQVGNADTSGSLPSGTLTDNGQLGFNRTDSVNISSVISGSGAVAQNGDGVLALSAVNSYAGATTINNGIIKVNNFFSLGATNGGAVTIADGGSLDLGGISAANVSSGFGIKQFYVAGTGAGGNGAILNTYTNQQNAFEKVTLTADATFNAPGPGGRFDLRTGSPVLDLAGFKLTKIGTNQISVVAGSITPGNIEISQGLFSIESDTLCTGSGTIIVDPAASLGIRGAVTGSFTRSVAFNGGTIKNTGADSTGVDSPITLGASSSLDSNGKNTTFNNVISESGGSYGLTLIGTGSFIFAGANTYTGPTIINAGRLALSGSGSLTSTNISVAGGATFDVSTITGGFMLADGQTLTGAGSTTATIGGPLNLNSGALVLDYTVGTPALQVTNGTLSFNNNAVTVNVSGTPSQHLNKLIAANAGGAVGGTLPASPTITGLSGGVNSLTVSNGELYLVVDQAPVAGPSFTNGVVVGVPFTVPIVGGKYGPTDADGDVLTITSVSGAANGTVSTDGTNVTYTATGGSSDSFSYTVSDGFGGTASQTVYVLISSNVTGNNQVGAQMVGGQAVLTYYGIPNRSYALDWTHSLTPPVTWTPLLTNAAGSNGQLQFTNTPSGGNDFYRTRSVGP